MYNYKFNSEKERSTRFLVVDDHAGSRGLVRTVLAQSGFKNIKTAEDGLEALCILEGGEIDIVVCDWNMPVMTGIDLLKKVRRLPDFKEIPFVMLTAQQDQNEVILAFSHGVSDYVIKPFTPEVLLSKVSRILKKLSTSNAEIS